MGFEKRRIKVLLERTFFFFFWRVDYHSLILKTKINKNKTTVQFELTNILGAREGGILTN